MKPKLKLEIFKS